jgi:hypothetical protein
LPVAVKIAIFCTLFGTFSHQTIVLASDISLTLMPILGKYPLWGSYHDRRNALENASNGSQSTKKGASSRLIGRIKGGLNTKLHAVCDEGGRPIDMMLTAGNVHDIQGARCNYSLS